MNRLLTILLGLYLAAASVADATTNTLGTSSLLESPAAGSDTVVLAIPPANTSWTASTNAPWLHLGPGYQSGTGSTNVVFNFDANPGATRTGTLSIGGQTLTVTQVGSTYISAQTTTTLVSTGLNQPRGVAVDGSGNVYIADSGNNLVKKWTVASHAVFTLVSTGLNNPYSVAADASGNVYIADTGNNAIKEWSVAGSNVTTLVSTGLYSPSGVGVDGSGSVYIADGYNEVIYKWNLGNPGLITLNSLTPPYLCSAPGVGVDVAGNVYFDDTCGDSLLEWLAGSSHVVSLTPGWFYLPTGLAADGSGNVYIADQADDWVWKYTAASGSLGPVVSGFNRPGGVAVDGAGNIYVADTQNNAIQECTQLYLDPTPRLEGLAAGHDFLPPVLPVAATQLSTFAPVSSQPWLTITGVTNGVVYFSYSGSTSNRSGTITLFGQSFPVFQRGSSVSLGLTALTEGPSGGNDSVVLADFPYTNAWTATANVGWLHLASGSQSGAGSTNVFFNYDANPGPTRTGTLSIAGQALTVTQAGSTYLPVGPVTTLAISSEPGPYGVSLDGSGNVYFFQYYQNTIKEWSPGNHSLTSVVSPGADFLAADTAGNLYYGGNKWTTANNSVSTLVPSGFNYVAVDRAGNLFFPNGNAIQVMTPVGNVVTTLVSGLDSPGSVAVDAADNVYFSSADGLQEYTAANQSVTTLVPPGSYSYEDLAVDGAGNLYIVGQDPYYDSFALMKWTAASNTLSTVVTSGEGIYYGVAVDAAGNPYFTDFYDGLLLEKPSAFLDPSPRVEGLPAGHDALPPVLPLTLNLLAPFAPSSDSAWLTITGVTNGVVSYSFPTNLSLTRTGHISLLGQSIAVTQNGPVFTLGTSNLFEGPAAGSDSIVLGVTPNIGVWTATTNAPWLHLSPANSSGAGGTNIIFSFDVNPGATRSATLTIAGQTLTVTQAGGTYVAVNFPATLVATGLYSPQGVAVDGAGNVYIADTFNDAVKEWIVASNSVTTLVSSGLNVPTGVAVDTAGNVYIADTGNHAIEEWSAAGNSLTTLASGLSFPVGVALDAQGNVYIADAFANAIKKWSVAGNTLATLVSGLSTPYGVAVDAANHVYIANRSNSTVAEWQPASSALVPLVVTGLYNPTGLSVDGSGNVCMADQQNNAVKQWSAVNGTVTNLVTFIGNSDYPAAVAVDAARNVYIAVEDDDAIMELPHAFVDPTPRQETANAGTGALPVVLPATENLTGPFAPASDSSWLTINGITNGIVDFSFSANVGSSRTGHLSLLGQVIAVTQSGLTYALGANSLIVGPSAGSNSVVLAVAPLSATWTAAANAAWLHLAPAALSGTGSTNLVFSYDANPGTTRSGTLTIGGQTLTVTQAGSTYGPAGSLGALVSSGLSYPYRAAVDAAGNVYIADTINAAIRKWAVASNSVTTLVATGLLQPHGVAVDGAGNVYIADTAHAAIKEWSAASSNVTTLVSAGLSQPYGLALDSLGNVYIADTGLSVIKEWSPANNTLTTLVASGLSNPDGVAVDAAGNVYIADTSHNAIEEWSLASTNLVTLVASGLSTPFDVAVDGSGNVYIADSGHNVIKMLSSVNNTLTTLIPAGLKQPHGVSVNGLGNIYIADSADNAIKELPYAFVDSTAKLEGLTDGSDILPVVLPSTTSLLAPFVPASDQSWLAIAGIASGVVDFTFSTNSGSARTAHLNLLGRAISITQGLVGTPPKLSGLQSPGSGIIQFSFTNNPAASFTVSSATNLVLPLSQWTVIGPATNNFPASLFQFTTPSTPNGPQRYYTVHSP